MATTVISYKIAGGTQIVTVPGLGSAAYTVPANSFLILSITGSAAGSSMTFYCRGVSIAAYTNFPGGIYVGPGESITCTNGSFIAQNAYLVGVLYANN
jgi:hypothetical protein